jgi:hypothetical protein
MGDEHIREFNIVAKTILSINSEFKIVVGTDNPDRLIDGLYKVIPISEGFNFNLKRIPIQHALTEFNTIFHLDTDVHIRDGIDFSTMDSVADGPEGLWVDDIVPPERQDRNGSIEWIRTYLDKLKKYSPDENFYLIPEGRFILKSNPETADTIIQMWETIDRDTRGIQPEQYELSGSMEGFIIWISVRKAGIPIKRIWEDRIELKKMCGAMVHFASSNKKLKPTIL